MCGLSPISLITEPFCKILRDLLVCAGSSGLVNTVLCVDDAISHQKVPDASALPKSKMCLCTHIHCLYSEDGRFSLLNFAVFACTFCLLQTE